MSVKNNRAVVTRKGLVQFNVALGPQRPGGLLGTASELCDKVVK